MNSPFLTLVPEQLRRFKPRVDTYPQGFNPLAHPLWRLANEELTEEPLNTSGAWCQVLTNFLKLCTEYQVVPFIHARKDNDNVPIRQYLWTQRLRIVRFLSKSRIIQNSEPIRRPEIAVGPVIGDSITVRATLPIRVKNYHLLHSYARFKLGMRGTHAHLSLQLAPGCLVSIERHTEEIAVLGWSITLHTIPFPAEQLDPSWGWDSFNAWLLRDFIYPSLRNMRVQRLPRSLLF